MSRERTHGSFLYLGDNALYGVRGRNFSFKGHFLKHGRVIIDVVDGDFNAYFLCTWSILSSVGGKSFEAVRRVLLTVEFAENESATMSVMRVHYGILSAVILFLVFMNVC